MTKFPLIPALLGRSRKANLIALVIGVLVFVMFPLCSFQVRTTQVALVSTFGKLNPKPLGAGFHWKWPWPIQKVQKLDSSLQLFRSKYEEEYTADGQNLVLTLFAAWDITDPYKFLVSVGSRDEARRKLATLIGTEKSVVIRRHPVKDLIATTQRPDEAKFTEVEAEILARVRQEALTQYGISIQTLGIEKIALGAQTTKAVFARMQAERQNEANRIRQEGLKEAGKISADASRESNEILSKAQTQAATIRGEGDAAAASYYEIFEQDREFALFLRQLEALEEVMQKNTVLVIDRDVPPFSLLKGEFLKSEPKPPKTKK